MKTIKIDIEFMHSCDWIMSVLLPLLGVSNHEANYLAKEYWNLLWNGERITINPYKIYIHHNMLCVSNANNVCKETEDVLDNAYNIVGDQISRWEDNQLTAYENQCESY